ncbi:hypothetical protein QA612_01970 [Evansella sp. AB-P1]|uniref:hypothetical protein n=1 Tax=Evansella sp. AB-P1 TaxID=3037653 RepID=UPI00241BEADD|nr:hypothetical protein [Evansella sp. AB-P1]MDG5786240.1 hypothetical protein [Evansella sp. AB-P1]
MNQGLQIFLEYKIKPEFVNEYEKHMNEILVELEQYSATEVDWYEAADQKHLYVEMFKLPTMAHYHAIKEMRQNSNHAVFGRLDQYVDGGIKKVHCWAFVQRK